jgi:lysophospholipase L1-like esterase
MNGHWVHTWASTPQPTEPDDLPPVPFTRDGLVLADCTLRQSIRASVGGRRVRLRISNAYGGSVLPVTMASVALPAAVALPAGGRAGRRARDGDGGRDGRAGDGVAAIQPDTARMLTFDGRASVDIPAGAQAVCDPLDFAIAPRSNLSVTIYLAEGLASTAVTSHPGSRTTSFVVSGNHVRHADLPGAAPVEHWYFLSGLEVWSRPGTAAAVMLGDSLTDGRGSTTDGNDRWPDRLLDRLQACRDTADVAIVNQGVGGNRVLLDGVGRCALGRVDRDVLAHSGMAWLLVFEGANGAAQRRVADDLVGAYDQIVRRAQAKGILAYGGTITPFGGHPDFDDPAGVRDAARRAVNDWIRTSRRFDAVVDFDRAARDPGNPGRLLPAFDSGDHLHLNPAGYKALADAVPARLFRRRIPSTRDGTDRG